MRNPERAVALIWAILFAEPGVAFGGRWHEAGAGLPSTVAGLSLSIAAELRSTLKHPPMAFSRVRMAGLDPTSASTIYAGTGRGVFKSTDGSGVGASPGCP